MTGLATSPRPQSGCTGEVSLAHRIKWIGVVIQRWELIAHLSIKECGFISPPHPKVVVESVRAFATPRAGLSSLSTFESEPLATPTVTCFYQR